MAEYQNGNTLDRCEQEPNSESDQCSSPSTENDALLFFSYLDELQDRIEYLRRHAIALSQERDSLLLVLSQLKEESMTGSLTQDEFQEICVNMERLRTRCQTVDIKVQTVRNTEQEEAFTKVNALINELETSSTLPDKKNDTLKRAKTYLNACSSDSAETGAMDFRFQGMILDCVIEDQKSFRNRLENIVQSSFLPQKPIPAAHSSHTENCIKPSDIAAAVQEIPDLDDLDDSLCQVDKTQNHDCASNDSCTESELNFKTNSCNKDNVTAADVKEPVSCDFPDSSHSQCDNPGESSPQRSPTKEYNG